MIKSSIMELNSLISNRSKGVIPVSILAPFTKITVKNKKIGLLAPTDTKSTNNQLILFLLVMVYKSYCYEVLEV